MPKTINYARLADILSNAAVKDIGPIYREPLSADSHDWGDFSIAAENQFVSDGSQFVWGYSKWGSTTRKVSE